MDTAGLLGGRSATAGDYTALSSMRPHCQAMPHPGIVTATLFLTHRHVSVQFDARQDTPRHMGDPVILLTTLPSALGK